MALTEMVLMPGADYQAICNAVRAKTGGAELLKSGDIAGQIQSITGGGDAEGTDTSDATATPEDIAWGKTAYVNGKKISGNIGDYRGQDFGQGIAGDLIETTDSRGYRVLEWQIDESVIVDQSTNMQLSIYDIVTTLELTPDKIVAGNTILGVEGTALVNNLRRSTFRGSCNGSITIPLPFAYIDGHSLDEHFDSMILSLSDSYGNKKQLCCSLGSDYLSFWGQAINSSGTIFSDSTVIQKKDNQNIEWYYDPDGTTSFDSYSLVMNWRE